MKIRARKLVGPLVGLGIVAGLVYALWPSPVEVQLAPVERGALVVTVNEDGKTRVRERYTVTTPLAGRLLRIELDAGDPVVAGKTLLAALEPKEPDLLDPRSVAQAEARIRSAESSRQRAGSMLDSARAAYNLSESNYARAMRLRDRSAITREEFDDADYRLRSTAADVKSAQFAVQVADFELELARASLARTTQAETAPLENARFEIRSPVTGRVLRVFQESAGMVTAGTKLLELGDPANLECEIDVLSTDAVKITPGAKVFLERWGGEQPLEGRVRVVEPAAFTKVSALGVEEQRVNVVVDFTGPADSWRRLGDGYQVDARIVVWEAANVLKVPTGALVRHGDGWAVFAAERKRARLRPIRIGHGNDQEYEVLAGLQAGDQVVVHPSDAVSDGVSIVAKAADP